MVKKIVDYVKLQIAAGQATPAPPVGSALGPKGINIMDFCKQFNSKTSNQPGMIIPVVITIYSDKSFTFITKTPPASILILKAVKIEKGSKESNRIVAGKISAQQVEEIAKIKMPDLNCDTLASAASMVRGTARSMGIKVEQN